MAGQNVAAMIEVMRTEQWAAQVETKAALGDAKATLSTIQAAQAELTADVTAQGNYKRWSGRRSSCSPER